MPTPPKLSNEQRRAAYERSLQLRRTRAQLKGMLAKRELDLFGAFCQPDAQGMRVLDLLVALPRIGRLRALALLEKAGVKNPERATVKGLGPKQRERLFAALR